ncbi:metacaspase-1-like [Nicotiana tomentosiformis]|uniref:metacaspase-1-like n=1 Tax=Nicotiana tomentosiformis TaxID=4098 RepID=UPI00051C919E|nr:metacaspase-1-like [Nicotiana tomentosiformis]XP_016439518.1 PREDICTED: metacaspase-1-like [Nicotiana tabacum]
MSMACQKCRLPLTLPPYSQRLRCECSNLIQLGNSDRSLQVQERGRMSSRMRRFRDKIRRNRSRTKSLSPSPSVSPRLPLIFTKPPPSGKRAFLCGVTYKKEKFRLRGTSHDVNSMRDLLVQKFNFSDESILILAEEEAYNPPTRRNILDAFKWLMADLKSGDSLVFYFSGHGLRQPDFSDDETDGFDETICPLDFRTKGMIIDNAINDILVKPLISGVTLHAIIDSCHSGTVLDLPWVYKENGWADNRPPSGANKSTSGGRAISLSACKDNQLAADTSAFSAEKTMTGAMTCTFIRALRENPDITYQGLLDYMHKAIEKVNNARCPLLKVFQRKIDQEPVLSSSEKFYTNSKFKL